MMLKACVVRSPGAGRRRQKTVILGILTLVVMATAFPAVAGPGGEDRARHRRGNHGHERGHHDRTACDPWDANPRSRDLMQGVRAWRLAEVLELSEEEIPKFIAKLKTIDRQEAEFRLEHRHSLERIELLLDESDPDRSRLRQELDKLRDERDEFHDRIRQQRDELWETLSLEQQARLVLFEERFPREMRGMLHRIRGGDEPRPSIRRLPARVKCRLQELLDQPPPEMEGRPLPGAEPEGD